MSVQNTVRTSGTGECEDCGFKVTGTARPGRDVFGDLLIGCDGDDGCPSCGSDNYATVVAPDA